MRGIWRDRVLIQGIIGIVLAVLLGLLFLAFPESSSSVRQPSGVMP